jgi:hypothetical protein
VLLPLTLVLVPAVILAVVLAVAVFAWSVHHIRDSRVELPILAAVTLLLTALGRVSGTVIASYNTERLYLTRHRRDGPPVRRHRQQRASRGRPQRRRLPNRPRPAVHRQISPVDPPRLPRLHPTPLQGGRDQRRRGRQPARRQYRRRLLLDPDRTARRPPQQGQPVLHPLDSADEADW